MKRGHFEDGEAWEPRVVRPRQHAPAEHVPPPAAAAMCMKTLLSIKEASCVLGAGGSVCREIGQETGTKLHLSGRNEFYPGSQLQELKIKGPSAEAVTNSLAQVFNRIAEDLGRIAGSDPDAPEGSARLLFVVPVAAAKAIIGRGGENIKALRASSGLFVHVDEVAIGAGETAEQVVSVQGGIEGVGIALPELADKVAAFMGEPGFAAWAATSHAGDGAAPAMQVAPGKGAAGKGAPWKGDPWKGAPWKGAPGKGKGKAPAPPWAALPAPGGWSKGWAAPGEPAPGGWGKGWAAREEAAAMPGREYHHGRVPRAAPAPEWDSEAEAASMELMAGAIQSLPLEMLNPADRSQKVTFTCPAACVSAIIGKGGAGVKEISAATQTKVSIREIEESPSEKAVIVTGSAVGVAAAYLHVSGRIAALQMATPPDMEEPVEAF